MTTSFGWILLAFGVYGGLHSVLASPTAKIVAARWFGPAGSRYYRLFYTLTAVVTFIPVLWLAARLPDRRLYMLDYPLVMLGWLVQLLGLAIALAGVQQTGAVAFLGLDAVLEPGKAPSTPRFITQGVYRFVRHPVYSGSLLVLWATPLMTWNFLAFNLGATAYFIIGAHFEEQKLVRDFGSAYQEYRQRTPAFIPRLRK